MTEAANRDKINRLLELTRTTGGPEQDKAVQDLGTFLSQKSPASMSVGQCLDETRMNLQYVMFDLDATRRENHYLRRMLQSRSERDKDEGQSNDSGNNP